MRSRLNIYTSSFPYGEGEAFLLNELEHLVKEYQKIYVYPLHPKGEVRSGLPENLKVIDFAPSVQAGGKSVLSNLGAVLGIFKKEWKSPQRKYWLKNWKHFSILAARSVLLSKRLEKELKGETDHYCYWMNDWAVALAHLKKKKQIDRFVMRVHGFDIFDERRPGNYMPLKHFTYEYVEKVIANSERSAAYLKGKKVHPDKIVVNHLGTTDVGSMEYEPTEPAVIISSSRMVELKRVELIPEILRHCNRSIHWIHIGAGPLMDQVDEACRKLPPHILVSYQPFFSDYEEYMDYFKSSNASGFIHVSRTEGMGVVALEAMSLGVPIFTTDVGGAPEFTDQDSGSFKFPVNFDPKEVATKLDELLSGEANSESSRRERRAYWKQHFSTDVQVPKLIKLLQVR